MREWERRGRERERIEMKRRSIFFGVGRQKWRWGIGDFGEEEERFVLLGTICIVV